MVVAIDRDNRIVLWNLECARVTGYTADEVVGDSRATTLLCPARERRGKMEAQQVPSAHDAPDREWELTCKDGSKKTISWSNVASDVPIGGWATWCIGIDVTERVRFEASLRDSEETLRSVTDSSPDVLMVTDLDGTIRFINRPAQGLTVDEVLGTSAYDYVPQHAMNSILACHRRVIETGEVEQFPFDYETPSGDVVSYEVRLGPIFRDGKIAQLAFASTDVTQRKRSEEKFRAQYKHFPLPTYTFRRDDTRFVLIDYNDAAFEFSKGGVTQLLGSGIDKLFALNREVEADLRRCFDERTTVRRETHYHAVTTREVYDLDITYVFVPPNLVMVHADDIGSRKSALRALEQSRKSLADAQRIANLGNWDWNIETGELAWSDQIYRIFGIDPAEFGATYEAFLAAVHPEDRKAVQAAVERSLRENDPYAIDHRIVRQDGEVRVVHEEGEITRAPDGSLIRMVGTVLDITEQWRAEQEVRRSLTEKETLLREIHHRVKNNLQVVSSLLSLQSQKVDDPSVAALFTEMQQRVLSMAMIHESLYQSSDLNQVDFRRYLEMLSSRLKLAHAERNVRIETAVEDVSLEIHIAVPCGLIVNELVTNAFRHAFEGEQTGTVRVDFAKRNGGFRLLVSDNGRGLPPDLDVAHCSTLGFRLVRRLVEQLHGHLEVHRVGGSSFQITFG